MNRSWLLTQMPGCDRTCRSRRRRFLMLGPVQAGMQLGFARLVIRWWRSSRRAEWRPTPDDLAVAATSNGSTIGCPSSPKFLLETLDLILSWQTPCGCTLRRMKERPPSLLFSGCSPRGECWPSPLAKGHLKRIDPFSNVREKRFSISH